MRIDRDIASPMDLSITDAARAKIDHFLKAERAEGLPLRLSIVRTHCMGGRGHGYHLGIADGRPDGDIVVETGGLSVLVDPGSARLAEGVAIDYVETFEESGFKVTNPNSTGKCPCGHHDLFD